MTRKEAARELMGVWNNYEVRPIKFSTAYRWVFRNKCGFWQLNKMDRMRCPLRMADEELFNDIADAVEEWCDDNEVCYDEVDWGDAIDGEEGIIWEV